MGMNKIPCLGFGPANEIHAHQVEDQVPITDLTKAAAFYAAFPGIYTAAPEKVSAKAPVKTSAKAAKK